MMNAEASGSGSTSQTGKPFQLGQGQGTESEALPVWVEDLKEHFVVSKTFSKPRTGKEVRKKSRLNYQLICSRCEKDPKRKAKSAVNGNSSSTFIRHLKRQHPDVKLPDLQRTRSKRKHNSGEDSSSESDAGGEIEPAQPKITSSVLNGAETVTKGQQSITCKYLEDGEKQTSFNDLLLNMVIKTGVPFNIVDKAAFVALVEHADPRLNIASRRTLLRLLNSKNIKIKDHIKKLLNGLPSGCLHLLFDVWSSRQRLSVIGIQVRFIKDWKLYQFVVGFSEFPGSHSAENIKQKLNNILVKAYGISVANVFTVTADSASSILSAFSTPFTPLAMNTKDVSLNQSQSQDVSSAPSPAVDVDRIETTSTTEDSSNWTDVDSEDDELLDVDELQPPTEDQINRTIDTVIQNWSSTASKSNSIMVRRNSCLAHLLQLGVKNALDNEVVKTILKKVAVMINWFNKSNKELSALKEKTKIGFVRPVETRWNSTYKCLDRLCYKIEGKKDENETSHPQQITLLKIAYEVYSEKKKLTSKDKLSDDDFEKIETIASLLKPLSDLTDVWQADGITSSTVIVGLIKALNELESTLVDDENEDMLTFKKELKQCVQQRFDTRKDQKVESRKIVTLDVVNDKYYILSTLLDPRCKTVPFKAKYADGLEFRNGYPSEEQVTSMLRSAYEDEKRLLNQEQEDIEMTYSSVGTNMSQSSSTSSQTSASSQPLAPSTSATAKDTRPTLQQTKKAKVGVFACVQAFQDKNRSAQNDLNEVDLFLAEPPNAHIPPLKFWKNHCEDYPVLASLAAKLLAMPASSGSVERLFSVAGSIISQRRCSMKISTAEKVLLYKENLRAANKFA